MIQFHILLLASLSMVMAHEEFSLRKTTLPADYSASLRRPRRAHPDDLEATKIIFSIEKSAMDLRQYRGLVLPNQMRILLISDPETDKAAAAVCVAVGSLSNPEQMPGLAHLVEHMLFRGSKIYPVENDYPQFIADHGGATGARTNDDYTIYYFDVAADKLLPSLDRLSQLLIAPLFLESAMEREVKSVDSEYDGYVHNDERRMYGILRRTSDPTHPFSRFYVGNLDSLWTIPNAAGVDVRSEVVKFYETYYSSNLMTVAILGAEPLDQLTAIATDLFKSVLNGNVTQPKWVRSPFGHDQLQTCVFNVPLQDIMKLTLLFPIPAMSPFYNSWCHMYTKGLIIHQGPGSLLSLLKLRNWADDVGAHERFIRGFGYFSIDVFLSEEGLQHVNDVVLSVFQYLKMLKEAGPKKYIWEEMKTLSEVSFRFMEKEPPYNYVYRLSADMLKFQHRPFQQVITAAWIPTEYEPKSIRDFMDYLTVPNFRMMVTSKNNAAKANLKEQVYGIEYSVEKIAADLLDKWANCELLDELRLPDINPFIPTVFDLKKRQDSEIAPKCVSTTAFSSVWFLQDNEFRLPRALMTVRFFNPWSSLDPLQNILTRMLTMMWRESLLETMYAARIAGSICSLDGTDYWMEIKCDGYDQKLGILLQQTLKQIINFHFDNRQRQRFTAMKDQMRRKLNNSEKAAPRHLANSVSNYLLLEVFWTTDQLISSLSGVTFEELENYAKKLVETLRLEWWIYGNVEQSEALQLVSNCEDMILKMATVPKLPEKFQLDRELKLNSGEAVLYRKMISHHSDSCALVLYQCGRQPTTRNDGLMDVLLHILHVPCVNTLRTQEQLGYHVSCSMRRSCGMQALEIEVQGGHHPEFVEYRIERFIESFHGMLVAMSDAEFLRNLNTLRKLKSDEPKTWFETSRRIWNEIAYKTYQFNRQAVELEALGTIGKQDVIEYFEDLVGPGGIPSSSSRRLSIHVVSMEENGAGRKPQVPEEGGATSTRTIIETADILEWKAKHEFHDTAGLQDNIAVCAVAKLSASAQLLLYSVCICICKLVFTTSPEPNLT